VGFDFPQDQPIRDFVDVRKVPITQFVSHDVILRSGRVLIEYLCNLGAVKSPRIEICALPLRIPKSDGAPARVIAIER
jgi:kynurenine formamidase